ncbi:MAG TPA: hypothetical protein VKD43_18730 [Xanthobacteraceae bacterium]|nr:hypothetical protein [Xanthobacteraceae bacterium]
MRALVLGITLSALIAAPAMACGPTATDKAPIPPLAAVLDDLLPEAQLSPADLEQVKALRAQIRKLAAAGKETAAREAEEQAMSILGYGKAWLRCGPGTFMWMKRPGA